MDHLLSHDSRDLQVVDGVWNHTHTVAQYKGPHPTYIMYACARLVLWRSLHHLSASSCPHALWVMTHETSGSWIHPSPWQRVWSYPRDAVQHLMEYGTYTKMQGLWPLQASTPCTGVISREGNSFVRLSELHLVNALAGSSSLELSRAESLPMDPCSSGSCLCGLSTKGPQPKGICYADGPLDVLPLLWVLTKSAPPAHPGSRADGSDLRSP